MAERPSFQARQYAFAAHIRDPEGAAPPDGVDPRRMAVYRELFFNNLRNLLGTSFPVLRTLYGEQGWRRLVRAFLQSHRARTPYFPKLPGEFVRFVESGYTPGDEDLPYLAELAHYEYAELAVALCADDRGAAAVDAGGDLLSGIPAACTACRVHDYRWPVHRIAADYLPRQPAAERVHLAVFRGADDKVRFVELNALTARLLAGIVNNDAGRAGRSLLEALAREVGWADTDSFVAHGAAMLEDMRQQGLITGSRREQGE